MKHRGADAVWTLMLSSVCLESKSVLDLPQCFLPFFSPSGRDRLYVSKDKTTDL